MSKIDIDKFVCSMIEHYRGATNADPIIVRNIFDDCLKDQNLEYKDGKIVEVLGKHGGISPNWKIEAGKWYMCIKDGIFGGYPDGDAHFYQGEVYLADDRGIMDHHNNNYHEDFKFELEEILYEYFRPATDEEITQHLNSIISKDSEKPDTIRFTDKEELINCLGTAPTGNPKTIRELLREFFETFSILLSDRDAVYTKAELLSRYKKYEEAIMSIARKQILSEIDANEMLESYKGTFTSQRMYGEDIYKEGIEDTIKKIKEIDL